MPEPKKASRNAEIVRLRHVEGLTYKAIGQRFGLSKQRVARIIALSSHD